MDQHRAARLRRTFAAHYITTHAAEKAAHEKREARLRKHLAETEERELWRERNCVLCGYTDAAEWADEPDMPLCDHHGPERLGMPTLHFGNDD